MKPPSAGLVSWGTVFAMFTMDQLHMAVTITQVLAQIAVALSAVAYTVTRTVIAWRHRNDAQS
jgi:hypothetical protein